MFKITDMREPINYFYDHYGINKICVEIGVLRGDHAAYMHYKLQPSCLYLVDPWDIYDDYRIVRNRFSNEIKNGTIFLIRKKSEYTYSLFEDENIDLIYIDGDHTYNGVMMDLTLWYDKVKSGGLISGHDWNKPNVGVKDAVYDFLNNKKEVLLNKLDDRNFYFIKA